MADPLAHYTADEDLQDLDLQDLKMGPASDEEFNVDNLDGSGLDRYRMLDPTAGAPEVTYGQLVAPPSYEDSLMYEAAPNHLHPVHPAVAGLQPQASSHSISSDPGPGRAAGSSGNQQGGGGGDTGGKGAALTLPPPMRGASRAHPPLVVTVTDPVRRENAGLFGLKAGYTSYLVTTRIIPIGPGGKVLDGWGELAASGNVKGQVGVRRRFRDFVSLADCLKVRFRGYFLPPRPEKNAVEGQRATEAFVRERRAALERYLNTLACHPAVAASEELRVFLSAEGELEASHVWSSLQPPPKAGLVGGTALLSKQLLGLEKTVVDPVAATQPTSKRSDLLRAIKETAHAYAQGSSATAVVPPAAHGPDGSGGGSDKAAAWGAAGLGGPGGVPAVETELRADKARLEGARDALASASRAAERLVHRMERCATVHGDLGLSLLKLYKFEEGEGPHLAQHTGTVRQAHQVATTAKVMGTALVRVSRVGRASVGRAALELGALHDQLAMMPPAIKGLRTREKQLLTVDTLKSDMEARSKTIRDLEAAGAKTLGGDPAKIKKVQDLRADIAKLECSVQAGTAEYTRITGVNQQELVRLRAEFQSALLGAALALAGSQAAAAERAAEVWLGLAAEAGASADETAPMRAMVRVAQLAAEQGPGVLQPPGHGAAGTSGTGGSSGTYGQQQGVGSGGAGPSRALEDHQDPFGGQGWGAPLGGPVGGRLPGGGGAQMDLGGPEGDGQSLLGGPL